MSSTAASIRRNSPVPLYHQLKRLLLDQIERGTWRPGELIPGEQELQETYGLSRTTVRQALRELEIEGKVIRHRGRGTFVRSPKLTHSPGSQGTLTQSLLRQGMQPGWRVLSAGTVPAEDDLAARLLISPGEPVFRLLRLRLADAEPIGVHVAHLAPGFADFVADDRLDQGGSLDYLDAARLHERGRIERVLEAVSAGADEMKLLGVEPEAPMLRIQRLLLTSDGRPVETLRATYRGDRFQYLVTSVAPQ